MPTGGVFSDWKRRPTPEQTDKAIQAGLIEAPPGYVSSYYPSNNPLQANRNYQSRLAYAGIEAPTEPKKTALVWRLLDLLEHPRYATVGFVKGLTEPGEQGLKGSLQNALSYAWSGLTGEQEHSVTDIMQSYGVKNKLALALGGFAGNVLLDPTTYISPFRALNKVGVQAAKAPDLAANIKKDHRHCAGHHLKGCRSKHCRGCTGHRAKCGNTGSSSRY
jgi:hypothetical protein